MTEAFTKDEFEDALALMLTEARRDSPESLLALLTLLEEALGSNHSRLSKAVTEGKLEQEDFFNELFENLTRVVADGRTFPVPALADGSLDGGVGRQLARLKLVWATPLPTLTTFAGKHYAGIRPLFA